MKKKLFYILYLISFILLCFGGAELYLNYLLNHPEQFPKIGPKQLSEYYQYHDMNIIQWQTEMAQYDSALFYTLKPGEFVYENREFADSFFVNSIGVRDDEISLESPKIVMVGDSYGMGWGIPQNKTYASLVETVLDKTTLNAGISSYGTPREMKMLERINRDSLEYLIIQYCPNDYIELEDYIRNKYQLAISNKSTYDSAAVNINDRMAYYPFKLCIELLPSFFVEKTIIKKPTEAKYIKSEPVNVPKGFLETIRNAKISPQTKIYVFTVGVRGFGNHFMRDVKELLNKEFGSTLHDQINFLDFSKTLTDKHYFILDSHINSLGHQLIADTLVKYIGMKPKGFYEKVWYYDDENISIKASYLNHYKEGLTTYYWPNGQRSQQTNYKKGVKKGLEIRYSDKGQEVGRKSYN